jgi:16S rRNA (guanine1207-N2)-methyltransferase
VAVNIVKPTDEPSYKATLEVALHGARLRFHVAHDLFSTAALDPGTRLLLRTLHGVDASSVLDLGCGYGPLALFLKAWEPDRTVDAVDRDELAVAYTAANAAANGLEVRASASLGYDDIPAIRPDLIVGNIPAKAGPAAIDSILVDGAHFLAPGGRMAVVAIDRIAPAMRATLQAASAEVILERENRGYTCVQYRLPPPTGSYRPAFARGAYDRGHLRHKDLRVTTVWGLPEFDTAGYATQLALDLLPASGSVVVLNPGQGIVPAAASGRVAVDDRDLLALRNSARNAELVDVAAPDTLAVLLREREPLAVTLANLVAHPARRVVLAGTSTQVTRVIEALGADVVGRRKTHGFSAALLDR